MKKRTLHFSGDQTDIVIRALFFYTDIWMGRMLDAVEFKDPIPERIDPYGEGYSNEEISNDLLEIKRCLFSNTSADSLIATRDIYSEVEEKGKIAKDLYEAIGYSKTLRECYSAKSSRCIAIEPCWCEKDPEKRARVSYKLLDDGFKVLDMKVSEFQREVVEEALYVLVCFLKCEYRKLFSVFAQGKRSFFRFAERLEESVRVYAPEVIKEDSQLKKERGVYDYVKKEGEKYVSSILKQQQKEYEKLNKAPHNIVFLDIDGVLNFRNSKTCTPSGFIGIEKENTKRLAKLIRNNDAVCVLSSSWRNFWKRDSICERDEMPIQGFDARRENIYLIKKLAEEDIFIADRIEKNSFGRTNRGRLIRTWLDAHPHKNFVILDDERFDFEEEGLLPYWVKTSFFRNGFCEEDKVLANRILSGGRDAKNI